MDRWDLKNAGMHACGFRPPPRPPLFGLSLAALSMDPLPTLLAFSIQTTDRRDPHYPPGRGGGGSFHRHSETQRLV